MAIVIILISTVLTSVSGFEHTWCTQRKKLGAKVFLAASQDGLWYEYRREGGETTE